MTSVGALFGRMTIETAQAAIPAVLAPVKRSFRTTRPSNRGVGWCGTESRNSRARGTHRHRPRRQCYYPRLKLLARRPAAVYITPPRPLWRSNLLVRNSRQIFFSADAPLSGAFAGTDGLPGTIGFRDSCYLPVEKPDVPVMCRRTKLVHSSRSWINECRKNRS